MLKIVDSLVIELSNNDFPTAVAKEKFLSVVIQTLIKFNAILAERLGSDRGDFYQELALATNLMKLHNGQKPELAQSALKQISSHTKMAEVNVVFSIAGFMHGTLVEEYSDISVKSEHAQLTRDLTDLCRIRMAYCKPYCSNATEDALSLLSEPLRSAAARVLLFEQISGSRERKFLARTSMPGFTESQTVKGALCETLKNRLRQLRNDIE